MTVSSLKANAALLLRGRQTLVKSREELGLLLGWSKRTMARWESAQTDIYPVSLGKLAVLVHPLDPTLAGELARAGGTTLEGLGLVKPPATATPPLPPQLLVDAVVCAAADALKAVPETVRSALLAAFRRARELRMSVEDVEKALSPPKR